MPFPTRLLTEGEELVIDTRPHWIALVGPVLVTVLVIVAEALAFANIGYIRHHDVAKWIVVLIGVVIVIVYPVRAFIRWVTSHFVVTNERVIHRSGLIAKSSMEVPLQRINDVRFHQNVLERMIGAGDLLLESAGEAGQEVFGDVRHPEQIQKTIYELAETREGAMSGPTIAQRAPSTTEELQRLADLRDRGVLTEEEFQAQKARLLGGS